MIVLGLDPGFASIGWCVVNLRSSTESEPVDAGTITTTPLGGRYEHDDNVKRMRAISRQLRGVCQAHRVEAICAEAFGYPRQAQAAVKLAYCWGIIGALADELALDVWQVTPQELKRRLTTDRSASKNAVELAVCAHWPEARGLLDRIGLTIRNHAADALGAVVACLHDVVLKNELPGRYATPEQL